MREVHTPATMIKSFEDYIFPCKQNKKPDCPQWNAYEREGNLLKGLYGIDCKKADIVVIDYDSYKGNLNERQQELLDKLIKDNSFIQSTKSGGKHYFFRQPAEDKISCRMFNLLDIKGCGGYVCLYDESLIKGFETSKAKDFFNNLPVIEVGLLNELIETLKEDKRKAGESKGESFGPGNNNRLIAQKGHEAIKGIQKDNFKILTEKLIELVQNNPNNPKLETHVKDVFIFVVKNKDQIYAEDRNPILKPWEDIEDDNSKFLDPHGLFFENNLNIVSGVKTAGKTSCTLALLASLNKNFLYFSEGDNSASDIKGKVASLNAQDRCFWLNNEPILKLVSKEKIDKLEQALELIKQASEKREAKIIFFDPFDTIVKDANSSSIVALQLNYLQRWANKNKITVILAKNYRKGIPQSVEGIGDQIGGSKKWTDIPRSVVIVSKIEEGSKWFKFKYGESEETKIGQASVLWHYATNKKLSLKKPIFKYNEEDKCFKHIHTLEEKNKIFYRELKSISQSEIQAQEDTIILYIHENKEKSCGEIKLTLAKELKCSMKTVQNRISNLKKEKVLKVSQDSNNGKNYELNLKHKKVKQTLDEEPIKGD